MIKWTGTIFIWWSATYCCAAEYIDNTKPISDNDGIKFKGNIGEDTRKQYQQPVMYYIEEGEDWRPDENTLNRDELRLWFMFSVEQSTRFKDQNDLLNRGYTFIPFKSKEWTPQNQGTGYSWKKLAPPTNVHPKWTAAWWSLLRKERDKCLKKRKEDRQKYLSKLKLDSDIFVGQNSINIPEDTRRRWTLQDKVKKEDDTWLKNKPGKLRGPLPSEIGNIRQAIPGGAGLEKPPQPLAEKQLDAALQKIIQLEKKINNFEDTIPQTEPSGYIGQDWGWSLEEQKFFAKLLENQRVDRQTTISISNAKGSITMPSNLNNQEQSMWQSMIKKRMKK